MSKHMISRSFLSRKSQFHKPKFSASSSSSSSSSETHFRLIHKDWLSPNEVLKIFDNLNRPNSLISAWNQYTHRKDFKPNEAIYSLVIKKLAKAKNFDAIENIMENIKVGKKTSSSCRLSNDFFYDVIKIYGSYGGRIRKAIETLLEMPRNFNVWPNAKTFNFVLNLLVSARVFDVVDEVYLKAPMLGVEIDACCLNIMIKALCESGDLEGALHVLDEFPKQRCRPNVRTFSTLMHFLCEKGKVEEAFRLFDRMEKEGIDADTITFNILISGLRKQGRFNEGVELLERMKLKGCEPNPGSYQEVLYGLLDAGKFADAKEFVNRMVCESGGSPSFTSYKKLINGLCKDRLSGDVDWLLRLMVKHGFMPKMGMWREIVRCVCSRNDDSLRVCIDEILCE